MSLSPLQKVEIEGLADFRRELKALSKELPKELQKLNKAAVEPIARDAQRRYGEIYTDRSGKSRRSIRALASQTRAQVALGRSSLLHLPGQEFGSFGGPHKEQFVRPPTDGSGRFFYPAIREGLTRLLDEYVRALDKLGRRAFPGRGR